MKKALIYAGTAVTVLTAAGASAQLLQETFDTAGSSATFSAPAGSNLAGASTDFVATFGYNYGSDAVPASGGAGGDPVFGQAVGEAPNTPGGATATTGLLTQVNLTGTDSSVILFTNSTFSGDYEAQVDVYYMHDQNSGSTEDPVVGINTSGTLVPFFDNMNAPNALDSDGYVFKHFGDADVGGSDHFFFEGAVGGVTPTTGVAGMTWADSPTADGEIGRNYAEAIFAAPVVNGWPWGETVTAGGAFRYSWTEVRISFVAGVASLYFNDTLVATYDDADDTFASGKVMIGHEDSFSGVNTGNFMLFDNLIVTDLSAADVSDWSLYQ